MAIAEERNLTRAAKRLYISQPALTLYINKLEDKLGVKLFDRSRVPITLTSAGERYINGTRDIHERQTRLHNELAEMGQAGSSKIAIGIGKTRGMQWLPLLLPLFRDRCPQATVRVEDGTDAGLEEKLRSGEIDIAVMTLPVLSADLAYEIIGTERIVLAIARGSELVPSLCFEQGSEDNATLLDCTCLNSQTFITPSPGHGLYRNMEIFLNTHNIHPKNFLYINNSETAYRLAATGFGVAYTLDLFFRTIKDLEHPPIRCTLADSVDMERRIAIVYRKNCNKTTVINQMIEVAKVVVNAWN